mgnify:CR=1 FL=1
MKDANNLICTPRTAWYSEASSQELRENAAYEVRRGLTSKMPASLRYCVNQNYLNVPRKFSIQTFSLKRKFFFFLSCLGSMFDGGLNGASFSSLFPMGAPFLSSASSLLSDPAAVASLVPPVLTSSTTNPTSSTSTPSLLSSAGSSSPVIVPVSLGDSAIKSSHGNNNNNNNSGDSAGSD